MDNNNDWLLDPEIDKLLAECEADDSPLLDMSQPGMIEKLRAELKLQRQQK
jgi:hypothetical protein